MDAIKVLLQWSLATPQDWVELDLRPSGPQSRLWRSLPRKPEPRGGEVIDHQPGWVFDVCIQGWCLRGADHIALEPIPDGVRAYRWFDDLEDDETDYRHGQVIEFREGWVDRTLTLPDGSTVRHQGPDQRLTEFAEDMDAHRPFVAAECGGLPVEFKPWSEWVMPPPQTVIHGVWLDDALMHEHIAKARPVNWRDWVA